MDEDEKEGREEVCVMRGTREREKEAEREVWRLWILRSDPETFKT